VLARTMSSMMYRVMNRMMMTMVHRMMYRMMHGTVALRHRKTGHGNKYYGR
jgi:hypothetical protein